MEKIKLNARYVKEVLTREQLKQVVGGIGSGLCDDDCDLEKQNCPQPGMDSSWTQCTKVRAQQSCPDKQYVYICTRPS